MDFDRLKAFYYVARAGSVTQAARDLNVSQPALSQKISKLQEEMNTRLFKRTSEGLVVTAKGEILVKKVAGILNEVEGLGDYLESVENADSGDITLTATVAVASLWLINVIPEFMEMHPSIRLNVIGSDEKLDLAMREADVAIRPYIPNEPLLIQKPLHTFHAYLYASEAYLEKHGTPKTVEDLKDHHLISFGGNNIVAPYLDIDWHLRLLPENITPHCRLSVNSSYALQKMAESGLGIISMTKEGIRMCKTKLVRVLPEIKGPVVNVYYIYPSKLEGVKRIHTLYDFLNDRLKAVA